MTATMQGQFEGQTFADICAKYGVNVSAIQKAYVRAFGGGFKSTDIPTPEHWQTLPPLKKIAGGNEAKTKTVKPQTKPASIDVQKPTKVIERPAQEVAKSGFSWDAVRNYSYMALLFMIPLAHSILVWNEAWGRYGQKGAFAGITMVLITLAALLLSLDESKGVTSEYAVYLMGVLDFCSFFLHREEFGTDYISTGFAVILPMCAFAALFMLRQVKNL